MNTLSHQKIFKLANKRPNFIPESSEISIVENTDIDDLKSDLIQLVTEKMNRIEDKNLRE